MRRYCAFLFFSFGLLSVAAAHGDVVNVTSRLNSLTHRFISARRQADTKSANLWQQLEEFQGSTDLSERAMLSAKIRSESKSANEEFKKANETSVELSQLIGALTRDDLEQLSRLSPEAKMYAFTINPRQHITAEDVFLYEKGLGVGLPYQKALPNSTSSPILVKVNGETRHEFLILARGSQVRLTDSRGTVLKGVIESVAPRAQVVVQPTLAPGRLALTPSWRVVDLNALAKIEILKGEQVAETILLRPHSKTIWNHADCESLLSER